jgi:hypothetical protein
MYLLLAPRLHYEFLAKDGKPVQVNAGLPVRIYGAESILNPLEVHEESEGVYRLSGFAFLTIGKSIPAGEYDRQVVLIGEYGNYVFPAVTFSRNDVQKQFADLGMDLRYSGFAAFINRNALTYSRFHIGMIFRRTADGSAFFSMSDFCLRRSPNQLILETVGDPACNSLLAAGQGRPAESNIDLPPETSEAKSSLEKLTATEAKEVYSLFGWSFLTNDPGTPLGDYERQIVLFTQSANLVYPARPVPRPDVVEYFADPSLDLGRSGFKAFIDRQTVAPGTYGIGMKFIDPLTGAVWYKNTHYCLQSTEQELILEIYNDPGCRQFMQGLSRAASMQTHSPTEAATA